jgi:DNA-binding transcriptional LysR family regulator
MLDTYQLQVFLAVAETGSYTAAAQRLHLTQPAVSRHVHLLQAQLGVSLFRRVGRRVLPSLAGERLAGIARQVLALTRRVEEEMASLRGEAVGLLRVGGSGAPAWHALARLFPAFRQESPGVGLHLEALPPEGAGPALREGRLDIVLTEEEVRERGLTCNLLAATETVLAVPLDGPWEQRKRFPLRKLAEAPLILPAAGTPARRFLEEHLAGRNLALPTPVQALEVDDVGAALPLVAAGLGVALLPRTLLEMAPAHLRAVSPWPGFSWPLYLVRRTAPAGRVEELFSTFALGKGRGLLR